MFSWIFISSADSIVWVLSKTFSKVSKKINNNLKMRSKETFEVFIVFSFDSIENLWVLFSNDREEDREGEKTHRQLSEEHIEAFEHRQLKIQAIDSMYRKGKSKALFILGSFDTYKVFLKLQWNVAHLVILELARRLLELLLVDYFGWVHLTLRLEFVNHLNPKILEGQHRWHWRFPTALFGE